MFTAIVVDDDYPVLQYLSQAVKWKQLHIELLGTYSNGLEALEAIHMFERLPDIVITDIGMPKMNGLELIAEYSSINPDFAAIIISCHDEFHYAQKALKLNVQDYILKESLEVGQVEQILKNITQRLCSKQDQLAEFQHYKQLGKMNQTAVRNKFLKDTLYQNTWSKHEWIEKAGINGINLQSKQYVTMILSVDRLNEMTRVHRLNDHTIIFAVENVLQEILSDKGKFVIFNYNNRDLVVLYLTDDPSVEQSYVYHMMQTCIANIKQFIKIHVSGFIGRTVSKPKEIQDALLPMLQELEHRFYSAESSVSTWSKQEFSKIDIYQEYAKYYSMISEHIAAKNQSGLVMTIRDWSNWVSASRFHPDYVKEWVLQLLLDLHMKIKVTLHFQSEFSDEKLYLTISQIVTLSHLSEWFLDYLLRMAAKLSEITISSRPEVIKAQQYVIQHVSERITLEEMASYLNLNSSYFSRLFKRELNINFIEYVNRVKLQKAKELLLQSNKTVEEISDLLGYSNKSYFIKLFKRDVGTTPREFVSWDKSKRMMEESIIF